MSEPTPLELAQQRIENLANRAIDTLEDLLTSDEAPVRLASSKTLLDRAGLSPKGRLELSGAVGANHALDAELDIMIREFITKGRGVETTERVLEAHAGPATDESLDDAISRELAGAQDPGAELPIQEAE